MARSMKKVGGWKDRHPYMKNYANRRLRRKSVDFNLSDGKMYKKLTCSYDICDWKSLYYTEAEVIKATQPRISQWTGLVLSGTPRHKLFRK